LILILNRYEKIFFKRQKLQKAFHFNFILIFFFFELSKKFLSWFIFKKWPGSKFCHFKDYLLKSKQQNIQLPKLLITCSFPFYLCQLLPQNLPLFHRQQKNKNFLTLVI